ncbi:hypothetical protein [Sphaerochaeta sp. PS]|uniref:hypothetical protein n=1 Tax=Sphaerochaeta sp. PS TaxID=3076336 RepID=UPI0028A4C585|nr:hypothetical protein [Sphaerochaeta sp. PS]MDT4763226.1 hypothetical protein [Sphaerochaeta sp. PS]
MVFLFCPFVEEGTKGLDRRSGGGKACLPLRIGYKELFRDGNGKYTFEIGISKPSCYHYPKEETYSSVYTAYMFSMMLGLVACTFLTFVAVRLNSLLKQRCFSTTW